MSISMQYPPNAMLEGDLSRFNVVIGKNGSGKSTFLRNLHIFFSNLPGFNVTYVPPERTGYFARAPHIEDQMRQPNWQVNHRNQNQSGDLRRYSNSLLLQLETQYNRKHMSDRKLRLQLDKTFDAEILSRINQLFVNVKLTQNDTNEIIFSTLDNDTIPPHKVSSGESEAACLASEIAHFAFNCSNEKTNILLLDEPDVHLHPDMQVRVMRFAHEFFHDFSSSTEYHIIIATHSPSIICGLASNSDLRIGVKNYDSNTVSLKLLSEKIRNLAPFFGHQLSLFLKSDAPLLVEGSDDELVWQQASKSSQGRIQLFPMVCGNVNEMNSVEQLCNELLSVYDQPLAFSIRDGDGKCGPLKHLDRLQRYRLSCYAIENLLLTDDCLSRFELTWTSFQEKASAWSTANKSHAQAGLIAEIAMCTDRFRHKKIKEIRNLICEIAEKPKKPWYSVVAQSIASANVERGEHSIRNYLGEELCRALNIIVADN